MDSDVFASLAFSRTNRRQIRFTRSQLVDALNRIEQTLISGSKKHLTRPKKSKAKAKRQNPRCATIFLPSVLTKAVEEQLRSERNIDKIFNLLGVCNDQSERTKFLNEIFRFILREF